MEDDKTAYARPGGLLRLVLFLVALGPMGFALGNAASAQQARQENYQGLNDPPIGPFFFEGSQSYFELRFDNTGGHWGDKWWKADQLAKRLKYKGIPGRLAIVDSREKHDFLREKFYVKRSTWIGLRLWCSAMKSMWVDGSVMKPTSFKIWDRKWNRDPGIDCMSQQEMPYQPVYYTPTDDGFRWKATGVLKHFWAYFVEYKVPEEQQ